VTNDESSEPSGEMYEPPTVEDLDNVEGASVTAAGTTTGPTPTPTAPPP
jgi:hypothetical protein